MNKSILMSVQPKWLELILNGKKTIEIRKSMPNCELPIDVYLYCGKNSKSTLKRVFNSFVIYQGKDLPFSLNSKVICKFTLRKVDCVENWEIDVFENYLRDNFSNLHHCLKLDDIYSYANGKDLYYLYVTDLVIFDKPKELNEFNKHLTYKEFMNPSVTTVIHINGEHYAPLTKVQNWQYVEVIK